ncbi:MAG: hypothetical protein ACLRZ2_02540 [Veillonella sp.]
MVSLAYDYDMNVIDIESLRYHYYKTQCIGITISKASVSE